MSQSRFGFTTDEWSEMQRGTHRILCDVAEHRGTITYGELVSRISGGRISARSSALMQLVSGACRDEDEARGTVLASVVVRADSGMPGEGYFAHMEQVGADTSDYGALWHTQVERVWDSFAPTNAGTQGVAGR